MTIIVGDKTKIAFEAEAIELIKDKQIVMGNFYLWLKSGNLGNNDDSYINLTWQMNYLKSFLLESNNRINDKVFLMPMTLINDAIMEILYSEKQFENVLYYEYCNLFNIGHIFCDIFESRNITLLLIKNMLGEERLIWQIDNSKTMIDEIYLPPNYIENIVHDFLVELDKTKAIFT